MIVIIMNYHCFTAAHSKSLVHVLFGMYFMVNNSNFEEPWQQPVVGLPTSVIFPTEEVTARNKSCPEVEHWRR